MKTDIRRWWVINRLYHFVQKRGVNEWVREMHFMPWMIGTDVATVALSFDDLDKKPKPFLFRSISELFYQLIAHLFFVHKSYSDFWNDVRTVILECASEDVGWIYREEDKNTHNIGLKLTPKGKERYAVTSGITWFVNKHKTLWVLIFGLIVWSPIVMPWVIFAFKYAIGFFLTIYRCLLV